jgi:DNA-binding transcriptional MerR regulator
VGMGASLAIGDFSRATHLSIKALRHYHQAGLLEPAEVDELTGYRRYAVDQIPTAQVIHRFRDLDMPLDEIRSVLAAPDVQARNELISSHLRRLEGTLARTQRAAASLRNLLQRPSPSPQIVHRTVEATSAATISQLLDIEDAWSWYQGALAELRATLAAQRVPATGTAGGIFSSALFSHERGEATIFIPCVAAIRAVGRVTPSVIPAVELAIIAHDGPHVDIDLAYGSLAGYVARHALAIDGPIREYYLVGWPDSRNETEWRTEIGWPIFQTVQNAQADADIQPAATTNGA